MKNYDYDQNSWEFALKMHKLHTDNLAKFKGLNSTLVDRWEKEKKTLEEKYPSLKIKL